MIDINQEFETSSMTDVAYCALQTFAESGLDLFYLQEVNAELEQHGHWLLQLQYLYNKMDKNNFSVLSEKLGYDPVQLQQAFEVICRIS